MNINELRIATHSDCWLHLTADIHKYNTQYASKKPKSFQVSQLMPTSDGNMDWEKKCITVDFFWN